MLDWDDLRFFLAVARHGSLSAAARALKVTQPTVGRRLDALERRLGARLFQRAPAGLSLSGSGADMLAHAEQMERAALAAERTVSGRDMDLRGTLRVTASEWLVVRVLGPALAELAARHPGVTIDVIADARWLSLPRREADIALRPAKFTHPSIFQRAVARVGFGLYASPAYLAERGAPDFARQCEGHVLVTMSEEQPAILDVAWLRGVASRARVAVRTNGREALAVLGARGLGLVCLPRYVGDATPGLRLIDVPTPPPERRLWLGVHRDTRAVPRVRVCVEHLSDTLSRLGPALSGGPRPPAVT